jgi:hypothetical protein
MKEHVEVPKLTIDFLFENQFVAVRECLEELTAIVEKYPRLRPQLLPLGAELKTIVDAGEKGLVRQGGIWKEPSMPESAAKLTDTSGRVYRGVTVKQVEPDGLLVQHEGGVSKIYFLDLPTAVQNEYDFDPVAAERYRMARETNALLSGGDSDSGTTMASGEDAMRWSPKSLEDVADCSLIIENIQDGEIQGYGTGFLARDGNRTFVYTNIHVVEGADSLRMVTRSGKEIEGLGQMEIARTGFGYFKHPLGGEFGGDAFRIALSANPEKALTIAPNASIASGMAIGITGNTKGEGVITLQEGVVTEVEDSAMQYDVDVHPGNSGSPIVDLKTFQIVGIHTWGLGAFDDVLDYIWEEELDQEEEREKFKFGARFRAGTSWQAYSLAELNRQGEVNRILKKRIRLLCLLDLAEPGSDGIFPDYGKSLRGDFGVRRVLEENAESPVMNRLIKLDRALKGSDSGVRVSNVDLLKLYRQSMGEVLALIGKDRQSLGDPSRPFYYVMDVKQSRIAEICLLYERKLGEVCAWYDEKLGVGGTIPLSGRPRFPSLSVGISDLLRESLQGG